MPHRSTKVRPPIQTKMEIHGALAAGWSRVINAIGRGTFQDAAGLDAKLVTRTLGGESTPELHTALNSLAACPTALNEVLDKYGFEIRPKQAAPANDMDTVAGLSHLVGKWVEALADGNRDHRETCELATVIRPLVSKLNGICAEADKIKGIA